MLMKDSARGHFTCYFLNFVSVVTSVANLTFEIDLQCLILRHHLCAIASNILFTI